MLKRVLMIGFAAGLGLATLCGGTAQAGQWQYKLPPGLWVYYTGSFDTCASIVHVPNIDNHPALMRCDMDLTRIETLCYNPNDHDVRPGEAATKVSVFNTIDHEDLSTKTKGEADLCVGFEELSLGSETLCVNGNWQPVAALTTEFRATCTTEACTGVDDPTTPEDETCNSTVVKDTEVCECNLPAGYDIDHLPTPCANPLDPDPSCTAYECWELDPSTLMRNGNMCQLQQ